MIQQNTPEWHAARKGRVTASMVGAILGNSPHMTRGDAMRKMVRDALGAEPEFTGNVATEYGSYHEGGARVEFEMLTGKKIRPGGWHTREDWAGALPDGLLDDGALIEIKCPYGLRNDKDPTFKSLEDQPHYYDQVQFQLWVTELDEAIFYQWTPCAECLEHVRADQKWQNENLPKLRQFYAEYLEELKAPERHLEPKRAEIDTPQAQQMVEELDQLAEAIELAQARRKEVLDELVKLAGERNAIVAGRNLTKVEKAGAVSYAKALKKYAPDADLEPFRGKPSSYWVLK